MTPKELIFHTLLYNQPYYKDLLKDIIAQRNMLKSKEDSSMHKDIDNQFVSIVRSEIAKDLAKRHGLSTEDILVTLENVNLLEYLL